MLIWTFLPISWEKYDLKRYYTILKHPVYSHLLQTETKMKTGKRETRNIKKGWLMCGNFLIFLIAVFCERKRVRAEQKAKAVTRWRWRWIKHERLRIRMWMICFTYHCLISFSVTVTREMQLVHPSFVMHTFVLN